MDKSNYWFNPTVVKNMKVNIPNLGSHLGSVAIRDTRPINSFNRSNSVILSCAMLVKWIDL